MRRFFLFGIAGTLGFFVDAGIAELLIKGLNANYYVARLASFLCAVTTTYAFNRHFTFSDQINGKRRGLRRRYLTAMAIGFCFNYGTYALLGLHFPFFHDWPTLAILAGSFSGLAINYLSARYWVFRCDAEALSDVGSSV